MSEDQNGIPETTGMATVSVPLWALRHVLQNASLDDDGDCQSSEMIAAVYHLELAIEGTPLMPETTVELEAFLDPAPPHWLSGAPWRWEIRGPKGSVVADGQGCRTAASGNRNGTHMRIRRRMVTDVR